MTTKQADLANKLEIESHTYAHLAPRLHANGYAPIPVIPGTKKPSIPRWTTTDFRDEDVVKDHVANYAAHQIGLVLGDVIAIDIDCLDESIAYQVQQLCIERLGATPIRVGRAPKRMLFYRSKGRRIKKKTTPSSKRNGHKQQVEFLANGSQCVVYGTHPETQLAYEWVELSLLDIPIESLNPVDEDQIDDTCLEITRLLGRECDTEELPKDFSKQKTVEPAPKINRENHLEQLVKDALRCLDPEDYDTWIAVGHAMKAEFGDSALPLFQVWSSAKSDGSPVRNFVSNSDVASAFETFQPNRTGINALFIRAAKAGWSGLDTVLEGVLSHTSIARFLLADFEQRGPRPVFAEGRLWLFGGIHWNEASNRQMRAWVQDLDGVFIGNKRIAANKALIDGVINELLSMCEDDGFFSNAPIGINSESGFIRVSNSGEATLEQHCPEQAQRHVLYATWQPGAELEISGLLQTLLDGCFGRDSETDSSKRLILQIIGVACSGASRLLTEPKAFVCFGQSGANGKSEVLNLVRAFLPQTAVSAISPEDFSKDQHLAALAGKMANITDELSSSRAIASDKFKQLVTGETVSAKEIYRKVFSFESSAIHLFATNTLPEFRGGIDGGVKRRIVIIPFDRIISRKSRIASIGKRVASEQGTLLLALAVAELQGVVRSGGYDIPGRSVDATDQWLDDSDPVLSWLKGGILEKLLAKGETPLIEHLYTRFRQDKQEYFQGTVLPTLRKFAEQLRGWVSENGNYEVIRMSSGNVVRKKSLV
ncbi:phage/plasmid primase, P4 family [Luminiphilus sp.]|nr:phage/plasmid primase, P4 family [Luminiphilus sp.]